jgi:hypothetical protein
MSDKTAHAPTFFPWTIYTDWLLEQAWWWKSAIIFRDSMQIESSSKLGIGCGCTQNWQRHDGLPVFFLSSNKCSSSVVAMQIRRVFKQTQIVRLKLSKRLN